MSERSRAKSFDLQTLPAETSGVIVVDLKAVVRNYRALQQRAPGSEVAAVVKANGYGLGAAEIATAFAEAGCRTFFVATFAEGAALSATAPDVAIYVLDGLFPGTAPLYQKAGLRPVLGSLAEAAEWAAFCKNGRRLNPAALHIDTGMTRLGLQPDEASVAIEALSGTAAPLLMSHLACADEPAHEKNGRQLALFNTVRERWPTLAASLSNSSGIFLGQPYHYDLVRPGIALYGGKPNTDALTVMNPVVTVYGRIAQVRIAERGETVGYGAAQTLRRRTRIATVSLGYADGLLRAASASDAHDGVAGYIGDDRVPLLGRVSMDLIMFDVTGVPEEAVVRGGWIELIGERQTIDDVARVAGTIGYEVLTSLSRRIPRVYVDA